MINHILANSQINSIPPGVNSFLTERFSTEQTQKFTCITSRRADLIHSQREIKEILDPEKHTFSIKSEHKSTQKSSGSSSLRYSLPSL